jgi:hypothetical protein
MDDDRAPGWLMARVELALAVIAVLVFPILYVWYPNFIEPPTIGRAPAPWLGVLLPVIAEILMILALAWMIRIWRGPTREAPPAWRYRDGD